MIKPNNHNIHHYEPTSIKTSYNPGSSINDEKTERLKRWITFYRRNIHRFMQDYMGLTLYPYQILIVWMLQHSSTFYAVASRASAKSWLIAAYSIARAILYPGIKVIVCAKTQKQAGIIINEKARAMYSDSTNLQREIKRFGGANNSFEIEFWNGSYIKAVTSDESSRGNRANDIIVEESRLVPKEILESIIKPFFEFRTPPYRTKEPYNTDVDYRETNNLSYITSAYNTNEPWYDDVKSVLKRIIRGDSTAHFVALDYLISVRHGIKSKQTLKNEMLNNNRTSVLQEYYNMPTTTSSKAFFDATYFHRVINKAFYPQRMATFNIRRNPYQVAKVENELRIVSADIATRAGKSNDLTILSCVRLIPGRLGYDRELLHMEAHSGVSTTNQALRIKQIFFDFESDFLVLDTQNIGLGVFEQLGKAITDEERNIPYPAFTLCNLNLLDSAQQEDYLSRVTSIGALPVVFPVMASASLNSRIASEFKSALQNKKWEFLIHPVDAENFLVGNQPEYLASALDSNVGVFFMNPYVQTSAFIDECLNLDMSMNNGLVKLERKNGRKDRYTSVAYANLLAEILDRDLIRESSYENEYKELSDYLIVV